MFLVEVNPLGYFSKHTTVTMMKTLHPELVMHLHGNTTRGFLVTHKLREARTRKSASLSQHSSVQHPHYPEGEMRWRWSGGDLVE